MINGQDALFAVAFTLKKEARPEREVASDVARIINISYAKSSFLLRLMFNQGYIAHESVNSYTLVSLTPKACARVREINIQRRELQRLHDHEDAIARAEAMGDYERASRLTRELLEA